MSLPKFKHAKPHLRGYVKMLHAAAEARGLGIHEILEALGMKQGQYPAAYNWFTGKNGPSPATASKLAEILGLTQEQAMAPLINPAWKRSTNLQETPEERAKRHHRSLGPAQRAVALAGAATSVLLPANEPPPVRDVFTIVGRSDGQISVRLQATLDAQRGMALARFLMDFGLIVGDEQEEDARRAGPPSG